jgi:thiamine biosynthesis protein ThiI
MQRVYLVKYGELSLKGQNRRQFESRVEAEIRRKLPGLEMRFQRERGRLYVQVPEGQEKALEAALGRTFGIVGFAASLVVPQDMEAVRAAAGALADALAAQRGSRFKIEARRADKSFPQSSYQIACLLGDDLRARIPGLTVSLRHPDWTLNVEVRRQVYLYGPPLPGPGGLPLGASGRGLLLLSGGIDSPVAGYLMGKRGLHIDAVYFHTPPYTSEQALDKVRRLAAILSGYLTDLALYVASFTELQLHISRNARPEQMTLLMRAAMFRVAERLAHRIGSRCLVTGESLGQVASQTVESLHFTGSQSRLPVFRPLIGMDKEEIIGLARRLGTFDTSIEPYLDCCALFSPAHPLIRPKLERMLAVLDGLQIDALVEKTAAASAALSLAGK